MLEIDLIMQALITESPEKIWLFPPTVIVAHNGLMNSEGHRANILSPEFSRVGIGVIDNGIYGKIFVQIFTD